MGLSAHVRLSFMTWRTTALPFLLVPVSYTHLHLQPDFAGGFGNEIGVDAVVGGLVHGREEGRHLVEEIGGADAQFVMLGGEGAGGGAGIFGLVVGAFAEGDGDGPERPGVGATGDGGDDGGIDVYKRQG